MRPPAKLLAHQSSSLLYKTSNCQLARSASRPFCLFSLAFFLLLLLILLPPPLLLLLLLLFLTHVSKPRQNKHPADRRGVGERALCTFTIQRVFSIRNFIKKPGYNGVGLVGQAGESLGNDAKLPSLFFCRLPLAVLSPGPLPVCSFCSTPSALLLPLFTFSPTSPSFQFHSPVPSFLGASLRTPRRPPQPCA